MILVMDVGNTNIKAAVFSEKEMLESWRISTSTTYTSDEFGITFENIFKHAGLDTSKIESIFISSVVPTVNFTLEHMCRDYFNIRPTFVNPGIKTGINIRYENPRELGSDRICNAVAAYYLYGGPCIFIDFGTASSYGVVDKSGSFLGGAICPGIRISSEALVTGTAKLPHFELIKPDSVISKNTVSNLQSGLIYGYVGQVEYIVSRMKKEMDEDKIKVIATGGFAHLIATETNQIDLIDPTLTLKGLRLIAERNK